MKYPNKNRWLVAFATSICTFCYTLMFVDSASALSIHSQKANSTKTNFVEHQRERLTSLTNTLLTSDVGELLNISLGQNKSVQVIVTDHVSRHGVNTYTLSTKNESESFSGLVTIGTCSVFMSYEYAGQFYQFQEHELCPYVFTKSLTANDSARSNSTNRQVNALAPKNEGNDITVIRVLPVLTQGANQFYNGEGEARVFHLFEVANQIYQSSKVKIEFDPTEVSLVEASNLIASTTLSDLGNNRPPYDDEVRTSRIERAADFVVLFESRPWFYNGTLTDGLAIVAGGSTAIGYQTINSVAAIVNANSDDWILAHELGHILGLQHDRRSLKSDERPSFFPYGLGYAVDGEFYTLMADPNSYQQPLQQILRLSSPYDSCLGIPCGVVHSPDSESSSDAVSALNQTRHWAGDIINDALEPIRIQSLAEDVGTQCQFLTSNIEQAIYLQETGVLNCKSISPDKLSNLGEYLTHTRRLSYEGNQDVISPTAFPTKLQKALTSLTATNIHFQSFDDFKVFENVEYLTIKNSKIVDAGQKGFSSDSLQYLYFSQVPLESLNLLNELANLRSVNFYESGISDLAGLTADRFADLENIDLQHNNISDLSPLSGFRHLKSLSLSYNPINNDVYPVSDIIEANPEIRYLGLDGLQIYDDSSLAILLPGLQLINVSLADNRMLTIPDLSLSLQSEEPLRYLSLSRNKLHTISGFKWLNQVSGVYLEGNNIYDVSALFDFQGQSLWLRENPIFCWQKNLLEQHFAQTPNRRLLIDETCTEDRDQDLLPDIWENAMGLSSENQQDANDYTLSQTRTNLELFIHLNLKNTRDVDMDNVVDTIDVFPLDPTESQDLNGDGIGNNADPDDDNDGYLDEDDAFPHFAQEWEDTDGDGVGDNTDNDDDNDGVEDAQDLFPKDATRSGTPSPVVPDTKTSQSAGYFNPMLLFFLISVFYCRKRHQS